MAFFFNLFSFDLLVPVLAEYVGNLDFIVLKPSFQLVDPYDSVGDYREVAHLTEYMSFGALLLQAFSQFLDVSHHLGQQV